MTDKVLQDTLKVTVQGVDYEFRIPGLAEEIKLSMHERRIRRQLDPQGDGSPEGLDAGAHLLVRSAAFLEVLLVNCSSKWPYSEGPSKEPIVDFQKFPKDKVGEAAAVGLAFQTALEKFRSGGAADGDAAGGQALAGGQDPGASQSVSPGPAGA